MASFKLCYFCRNDDALIVTTKDAKMHRTEMSI